MAYLTYNEHTIQTATGQLIGFINRSFCEFAMRLALESELSDLKGWVVYNSFTGMEFELLESLSHPVIRIMSNSIKDMTDAFYVFIMINALDELEVMEDEQGNELAEELFNGYMLQPLPSDRYCDVLSDITYLYQVTTFMLYVMTLLFSNGGVDLDSADFKDYWDEMPEGPELDSMDTSNKNISLIHELIVKRQAVKRILHHYL